MLLLGVGLSILLDLLCLNLCYRVRYVTFNTRLNLLIKKKSIPELYESGLSYFSVIMFGLFLSECEKEQILLIIIVANINFGWVAYFVLKLRKLISGAFFIILSICLFSIAVTPASSILCILVFEIGCLLFINIYPHGCHFSSSYCQMTFM